MRKEIFMYREKRIKEKKSFRLTAIVLFTLLLSIGVISTTSFADDTGKSDSLKIRHICSDCSKYLDYDGYLLTHSSKKHTFVTVVPCTFAKILSS